MSESRWATLAISAVIVILRLAGVTHEAYQAMAHLWVGGLIASWWWGRGADRGAFAGWIAIVMSLVELGAFIVGAIAK